MKILAVLFPSILLLGESIISAEQADPLLNFINAVFGDEGNSSIENYTEILKIHEEGILEKIIDIAESGSQFSKDMHATVEGHFAAGKWDSAVEEEFGKFSEVGLFLKENSNRVKQKIFDWLDGKLTTNSTK